MAEDLGKLSPEQVKKLAGVISDAKSLTKQQADIIEQVLAGELEIGKLRIANLQEYFDIYSRNLDLIARKHSALNDAFLVLDHKLMESYSKAVSGNLEASSKRGKPSTKNEQSNSGGSNGSGGNPPSGSGTPPTGKSKDSEVSSKISDDKLTALETFTSDELQQRAEELARFFQKSEEQRRDTIIKNQGYLKAFEDRRREQEIDRLKTHARKIETLNESIMDLELVRYQTEKDRQNQMTEIRLGRLQDSVNAELEAQALINKIAAEVAYSSGEILNTDVVVPETKAVQQATEAEKPEARIKTAVMIAESEAASTSENDSGGKSKGQQAPESNPSILKATQELEALNIGKNGQRITEAGEIRQREVEAKDRLKAAQAFEKNIIAYRAKKELEAKRKNNGILSKEDASRIEKEIAKKFTLEKLNDKKRIEAKTKLEAEAALQAERKDLAKGVETLTGKGKTFAERKEAWYDMTHDESGEKDKGKAISAAITAMSSAAAQLEKKIDEIASYKSAIDTRLQGSSNNTYAGSYWDQLTRDMAGVGAINPYFKQETFANNIKDLVNRGIAFDLKQRAFLMTIQDKIATTFDVADGTLLRLIRIQQEDSTAGRLGMESALNTFLNNMYETSEYLSQVADSVRGSLEEMQSLMSGAEAAEVEYQVQKWLGSLYSVGMSQSAVQSISDSLGKIAAGQIEGLTNGGAGNLLIMAANEAGLSIADILTGGINSDDTNKLLQATVNYLAELSDSAQDNRVVQQQLAEVFGVKASDLRAATNLAIPGSVSNIYNSNLQYGDMLSQLVGMASSMGSRTSLAEMMTNFWDNGQYTLAGSMASNPVSYFIYKMAGVLDSAAGGIALPFVNVLGSGVDLNTTVSDLLRIGAVGTGILGSIAPLISGLSSSFSGAAMLNKLGIEASSGLAITPRGNGTSLSSFATTGGLSTSESGYVGNASGSDIKNSTLQEAEDTKKQHMIEAKETEEANQIDVLNTTVLKIYELLDDVANGDKSLRVKVDTYGLTNTGNHSVSALGGVSGITGNSGNSNNGSGNSGYGVNSGGVSGSIDLGGWISNL